MKTTHLILVTLYLSACGSGVSRKAGTEASDSNAKTSDPLLVIHDAKDKRFLDPSLFEYAKRTFAEVRAATAEAVGEIGDIRGTPILEALVDDENAAVRNAAIFASGQFGLRAPDPLVLKLRLRLESQTDDDERLILFDALARVGKEGVPGSLVTFVTDTNPRIRAGAIRALGILGERGVHLGRSGSLEIAARMQDENAGVRFMAAFYFGRTSAPVAGQEGIIETLERGAAKDPSPQTRAYAIRALAKRGGLTPAVFEKAINDEHPAVSATATQVIDTVDNGRKCRLANSAVRSVAKRLAQNGRLPDSPYIHTIRGSLEAVSRCPVGAADATKLDVIGSALKNHSNLDAGIGYCNCLLRLAGGANLAALVSCDPERPSVGKRMLARRLSNKRVGRKDNDLATLIEMVKDTDIGVAVFVVGEIGNMDNPEAVRGIVDCLEADQPLVVAAALEVIAGAPERYADYRDENDGAGIVHLIGKAVMRFSGFDSIEVPVTSALLAFKAIGSEEAKPYLRKLETDRRSSVRFLLRDTYDAIEGVDPPMGLPPLEPVRPAPFKRIERWRAKNPTATIHTTKGLFVIQLLVRTAPATVDNFVSLAKSGYFDMTPFHRVVPNFVIQGGDPTATGLGDPGYTVRCENSPLPYERGVVGMALAGKDTGGSQFFVTTSRQPHLDGNYTAFGRVITGMEVVDTICVGDLIERVYIDEN